MKHNRCEDHTARKIIYKTTIRFEDGTEKIYVGQDITDSWLYMGSPKLKSMEADKLMGKKIKEIVKSILWESYTASKKEIDAIEKEFIVEMQANRPGKGYNLRPKYKAFDV